MSTAAKHIVVGLSDKKQKILIVEDSESI